MPARGRANGTGRTYDRLQEQAIEAEMLADEAFVTGVERLLARINNPKWLEDSDRACRVRNSLQLREPQLATKILI